MLLGNNQALFDLIRSDPARVRDAVAWWLEATGGYGVKLVNPGGVERWKRGDGNVSSLDDVVAGVTPREVLAAIAGAVHDLELPHPVHVHCNNLGVGGNWKHHARHAGHDGGPARASRAPPVPRLRRQARRAACARARRSSPSTWARIPSSAPTSGR